MPIDWDETFHYSPPCTAGDVLCGGSDIEADADEIRAKHGRYEREAERCRAGKRPVLISTLLRGTGDAAWQNPWRWRVEREGGGRRKRERCKEIELDAGRNGYGHENGFRDEDDWFQPRSDGMPSTREHVQHCAARYVPAHLSPVEALAWCQTEALCEREQVGLGIHHGESTRTRTTDSARQDEKLTSGDLAVGVMNGEALRKHTNGSDSDDRKRQWLRALSKRARWDDNDSADEIHFSPTLLRQRWSKKAPPAPVKSSLSGFGGAAREEAQRSSETKKGKRKRKKRETLRPSLGSSSIDHRLQSRNSTVNCGEGKYSVQPEAGEVDELVYDMSQELSMAIGISATPAMKSAQWSKKNTKISPSYLQLDDLHASTPPSLLDIVPAARYPSSQRLEAKYSMKHQTLRRQSCNQDDSDEDSFVTDALPSSRDLETFRFRIKRRRDMHLKPAGPKQPGYRKQIGSTTWQSIVFNEDEDTNETKTETEETKLTRSEAECNETWQTTVSLRDESNVDHFQKAETMGLDTKDSVYAEEIHVNQPTPSRSNYEGSSGAMEDVNYTSSLPLALNNTPPEGASPEEYLTRPLTRVYLSPRSNASLGLPSQQSQLDRAFSEPAKITTPPPASIPLPLSQPPIRRLLSPRTMSLREPIGGQESHNSSCKMSVARQALRTPHPICPGSSLHQPDQLDTERITQTVYNPRNPSQPQSLLFLPILKIQGTPASVSAMQTSLDQNAISTQSGNTSSAKQAPAFSTALTPQFQQQETGIDMLQMGLSPSCPRMSSDGGIHGGVQRPADLADLQIDDEALPDQSPSGAEIPAMISSGTRSNRSEASRKDVFNRALQSPFQTETDFRVVRGMSLAGAKRRMEVTIAGVEKDLMVSTPICVAAASHGCDPQSPWADEPTPTLPALSAHVINKKPLSQVSDSNPHALSRRHVDHEVNGRSEARTDLEKGKPQREDRSAMDLVSVGHVPSRSPGIRPNNMPTMHHNDDNLELPSSANRNPWRSILGKRGGTTRTMTSSPVSLGKWLKRVSFQGLPPQDDAPATDTTQRLGAGAHSRSSPPQHWSLGSPSIAVCSSPPVGAMAEAFIAADHHPNPNSDADGDSDPAAAVTTEDGVPFSMLAHNPDTTSIPNVEVAADVVDQSPWPVHDDALWGEESRPITTVLSEIRDFDADADADREKNTDSDSDMVMEAVLEEVGAWFENWSVELELQRASDTLQDPIHAPNDNIAKAMDLDIDMHTDTRPRRKRLFGLS